MAFMAERCAVASMSDWPADRKAMPGTAEGTSCFRSRTALGDARGQSVIFDTALAQTIHPFGADFARRACQRLGARIHLDARHASRGFEDRHQSRAVLGLLAQGFVIQDHARNMFAHGL